MDPIRLLTPKFYASQPYQSTSSLSCQLIISWPLNHCSRALAQGRQWRSVVCFNNIHIWVSSAHFWQPTPKQWTVSLNTYVSLKREQILMGHPVPDHAKNHSNFRGTPPTTKSDLKLSKISEWLMWLKYPEGPRKENFPFIKRYTMIVHHCHQGFYSKTWPKWLKGMRAFHIFLLTAQFHLLNNCAPKGQVGKSSIISQCLRIKKIGLINKDLIMASFKDSGRIPLSTE